MKKIIFFLALLGAFSSGAQSLNKNFTHVIEPVTPMSIGTVNLILSSGNGGNLIENINYRDGLGRRLQTIAKGQSPSGKDIVRHYQYDQYGRRERSYLPLPSNQSSGAFISSPVSGIHSYYYNEYGDNHPYAQTRFESSPLNRILESTGPGDDWALNASSDYDRTIKMEYGTNGSSDIRRFDVATDGSLSASYYPSNSLIKTVTKSENWQPSDGQVNTTEIYTDKNGRKIAEIVFERNSSYVVEERLTQYVYDDLGRLRYVLPPKFFAGSNSNFLDYSVNWPLQDFIESGTYLGSMILTISNNVLRLRALQNTNQNGFMTLRPSTTKILNTTPDLPDRYLGKVMGEEIFGGALVQIGNANIVNGNLVITRIASIPFSSFSILVDVDLNNGFDYSLLDELAYQYEYDDYNRIIAQKVPGKGWEYLVYDQLDRPILTQDANLKAQNIWLFTKYDAFDRVAYGGRFFSTKTRAQLQTDADNAITSSGNPSNIEERRLTAWYFGGVVMNYTNNAFPTSGITEILTVTYYDNYSFNDPQRPATPSSVLGQPVTYFVQGLQTGKWIKTVGENTWTKVYTYYDAQGRSVRVFQRNHLGGYTQTDNGLDFRGKVTQTETRHRRTAITPDVLIKDNFEYDQAERPTLHYQRINSQTTETITRNTYNGLGLLTQKRVGGAYSSSNSIAALQHVDYKYNIRGWLTEVNDVNNLTFSGDLFAYRISYNGTSQGTASVPKRYSGQINQVIWRSARDNVKRAYAYSYDDLSRLKRTYYREGTALNSGTNRHDTYDIAYDANGNITNLRRNNQYGGLIDRMTYNYAGGGNQLTGIRDYASTSTGFKDGYTGSTDYDYDDNGNLIFDRNRDVEEFYYNHLNLVSRIRMGSGANIYFTYNAAGEKIKKRYVSNSGGTTITDYLGGFQYRNSTLEFFPTPEGYASKEGSIFRYIYVYADHLGSNRVAFSDLNYNGSVISTEIVSNTNYYAMGMKHFGEYVSSYASGFNYKFQGKELQLENGILQYDFGSRLYDPTVGRWFGTDPQHQFASPYVAMANDPVNSIDPNGEEAITLISALVIAATVVGGTTAAIVTLANGGDALEALGAFIRGATMAGFMAGASAAPAVFAANVLGSASAAKVIAQPATWKAVIGNVAASYASVDIPISDNFSLSLSPALATGTNQAGYGLNLSANAQVGNFTFGVGLGGTRFTSNELLKGQGPATEFRFSQSIGYDDGRTAFSLLSTSFWGGKNKEFNQRVGGFNFRHGDFGVAYENDWFFGAPNGDDGDRFRTTGARISYGDFSAGLNMFTGDPHLDDSEATPGGASPGGKYNKKTEKYNGIYKGVNASKYRTGVLYLGYRNYRIGYNSEGIRNFFQNTLIHDNLGMPRFEKLDIKGSAYYQYQFNTPFTTW